MVCEESMQLNSQTCNIGFVDCHINRHERHALQGQAAYFVVAYNFFL